MSENTKNQNIKNLLRECKQNLEAVDDKRLDTLQELRKVQKDLETLDRTREIHIAQLALLADQFEV